jgi:aldose 1-epimerase
MSGSGNAATATLAPFGTTPDGTQVVAVMLSNANGISARIIAYGATLQALEVPDRAGRTDDIVLGYPDLAGYVARPQYFGATIGRYANRIAGAAFELDGVRYALASNNGANTLHGGRMGFDKVVWTIADVSTEPQASVTLTYVSSDGEEGFPGTLNVQVVYALSDDDELTIRYEATTDRPTVVNLSNHSYFNLTGLDAGRSGLDQSLMIDADAFMPVDAGQIPTGELRRVAGTPFDFTRSREIGSRIRDAGDPQLMIGRGYDHNFVLNAGATDAAQFAARLEDANSGRVMELFTTEPGLQLYSGNHFNGTVVGKGNRTLRQSDGIALEPQKFPDSPNRSEFPSARLDPGETYRHTSYLRFSLRDVE